MPTAQSLGQEFVCDQMCFFFQLSSAVWAFGDKTDQRSFGGVAKYGRAEEEKRECFWRRRDWLVGELLGEVEGVAA